LASFEIKKKAKDVDNGHITLPDTKVKSARLLDIVNVRGIVVRFPGLFKVTQVFVICNSIHEQSMSRLIS